MTGQTLIDSLTASAATEQPQPSAETPGEHDTRKGIRSLNGIKSLIRLAGAKSIKRNLDTEDDAFRSFARGKKRDKEVPDDDMEIWAGGDVVINNPGTESSGSQQPSAVSTPRAGGSWLPKLLVAGSMLAGGSGIGYILHDILNPAQQAADKDTDTITEFDFPK